MTIDLGFAFLTLPSGREVGIVDVPGHQRFIKNMLAGVGGVDVALFVVAATESWMPQSQEHLEILDLSGISRGVIVLTKVDLVDEEWLEMVEEEVREKVAGTVLEGAPHRQGGGPFGRGNRRAQRGHRRGDRQCARAGGLGPAPALGRPGLFGQGRGDGGHGHAARGHRQRRGRAGGDPLRRPGAGAGDAVPQPAD